MQLDVASYSNIGGREVNEDTTLSKQSEDFLLAAVADGLGGHGGGKTASTRAIQSLEEQEPLIRIMNEESLREACALANRAVLDAQTPQVRMKTTLALAAVSNSAIAFLHVGDSRAYLFRAGEIEYQSQDHSVSQLAVLMGAIRPEQIRFHEDRNKVLRSLGTEAGATPEIHVEDEPLHEGGGRRARCARCGHGSSCLRPGPRCAARHTLSPPLLAFRPLGCGRGLHRKLA